MLKIKQFIHSSYPLWLIILFHICLWFPLALALDIHPDMADHWVWSRFNSWGYYEHPPFVAWVMKLATLMGNPILSLKIGAIFFSCLILFLAYQVGKLYYDHLTGLIFVLILELTPYFSAGSIFWHIDQPFMIFWLLSLYCFGKYFQSNNSNWIVIFGVIAGLGALSKYIMVLFYLSIFTWCIFDQRQRKLLWNWKLYAAGIISLLILMPNLIWNAQHEWVSMIHNLKRGTGGDFGENLVPFTIGQLILFSILFTSIFWWRVIKTTYSFMQGKYHLNNVTSKTSFLLSTALVPAFFFTCASIKGGHADPHWLNITYFSAFLLLASSILRQYKQYPQKSHFYLFSSGFALNMLLICGTLIFIYFPVVKHSQFNKLLGWQTTANQIETILEKHHSPLPKFIITREYQLAGALSLYMKNHPWPYTYEKSVRNIWVKQTEFTNSGGVLVCPVNECVSLIKKFKKKFLNPFYFLGSFQTKFNQKEIRNMQIYQMNPVIKMQY